MDYNKGVDDQLAWNDNVHTTVEFLLMSTAALVVLLFLYKVSSISRISVRDIRDNHGTILLGPTVLPPQDVPASMEDADAAMREYHKTYLRQRLPAN